MPVLAPADPRTTPRRHGTVSFWPMLTTTGATAEWPWRAQALSQIHDLLGRGIPPTDAIRSTEYTTALRDTGTGPVPATQ